MLHVDRICQIARTGCSEGDVEIILTQIIRFYESADARNPGAMHPS